MHLWSYCVHMIFRKLHPEVEIAEILTHFHKTLCSHMHKSFDFLDMSCLGKRKCSSTIASEIKRFLTCQASAVVQNCHNGLYL